MGELPTGTVTFLFTDIEGSTRLWEQHPEAMGAVVARHDALLTAGIQQHSGVVVKSRGEGDSLFAVFARATDAVSAACTLQQALLAEPWPLPSPLRVRMALHTGEAEQREGDYYGTALNRCGRLRAAAHGGQILLSVATQELVRDHLPPGISLRDLGECRLKDLVRPERVFQLLHRDLPGEFTALRTLDTRPNNLPAQPTPLLGREQAVAAAANLLRREEIRLVTLTGPGGTGKTRLGLQVAADLLDDFPDGGFFVALAPISDPLLVASTIAQTLGVSEAAGAPLRESLKEYLRAKQMLLLLDNFEQALVAAPLVAELLAAAPRLKILVTSRAVLHLQGEHEFPVPPLALPDPRHLPPAATLSQYAAVELFIQRARAVRGDFAVTNENAPAVAEVCHRLDGLPLAIELAAARIKLFTPQALLTRLDSRLKLLTGGARDLPARQQTLRGAIAWSYDLLAEPEQKLFRRLAAFVGGCTLEAAEVVGSGEGDLEIDVLEGVASLVDTSLLQQKEQANGESRFTMLETIWEYGQERLAAAGEAKAVRGQHAQFFLAKAEQEAIDWVAKLAELEREHDNLRAALAWCGEDPDAGELGLRLATALSGLWYLHGHGSEAWRWLTGALAHPGATARTAARGKVLYAAAIFGGSGRTGPETRRQLGEESLAIAREVGDQALLGNVLRHLGQMAQHQGDLEAAWRLTEESLAADREAGAKGGIAAGLGMMGLYAKAQGDNAKARVLMDESVAVARERGNIGTWIPFNRIQLAVEEGDFVFARTLADEALTDSRKLGNPWATASILGQLGTMATSDGDYSAAKAFWDESLTLYRGREGERDNAPGGLEGLAALSAARGEPERAACLWGAAAALREALGHRQPTGTAFVPAGEEHRLAAVRAALGEGAFAAAWAAGRALSLEAAVAYALEEADA